jgi:hypothetical protein
MVNAFLLVLGDFINRAYAVDRIKSRIGRIEGQKALKIPLILLTSNLNRVTPVIKSQPLSLWPSNNE